MLQAPFGPTGAGWMTISSPGIPWFPTQLGPIGSPLSPAQQIGFGVSPAVEVSAPVGSPFIGQGPTTPLSTPFSIPDGITAAGLLTAIALRRGQPHGPASDQDVEEFIYDGLELLPGAGDVEVRCEAGRVTLTGAVPHKRLKRDIGEIAWAIPGIADVQNTLSITTRRRARAFTRDGESQPAVAASRKQSS